MRAIAVYGRGVMVISAAAEREFISVRKNLHPIGPLRRAPFIRRDRTRLATKVVKRRLPMWVSASWRRVSMMKGAWDQPLSGGSDNASLCATSHSPPDICVMDESTSALDKTPGGTHDTRSKANPQYDHRKVGHRPELEEFHDRKLILEYRKAERIVSDKS